MDKTQLKIIKQLFARPNDQNATEEELKNNLGILESDFRPAIDYLLLNEIVVVITNDNQTELNIKEKTIKYRAYALTLDGAFILNQYNRKNGFLDYIDRTGKFWAGLGGLVATAGLILQLWFSCKEDTRRELESIKHTQPSKEIICPIDSNASKSIRQPFK